MPIRWISQKYFPSFYMKDLSIIKRYEDFFQPQRIVSHTLRANLVSSTPKYMAYFL